MENLKFNSESNLEKFKKVKTNLFIKGALSKFQGFGDYIAAYGEKELLDEKFWSILGEIKKWDDIAGNEGDVSSGFIKQKEDILYFGENYPKFTKFPEQSRYYRQTAYSFIGYDDPTIDNAGKIFSALRPFKEYSEKETGKNKAEVVYDNSKLEIPIRLKDFLSEAISSSDKDQKLIVKKIIEPGKELLGEVAVNDVAVKSVMLFLDTLTTEQRKNFSLFFGDPQQWKIYDDAKIIILFKNFGKSAREQEQEELYYIKKGAVIKNWEEI